MRRGITVLACVSALAVGGYVAISKWGIQHESLALFDTVRQRPVTVDVAVRKDYEMKAEGGFWRLPVAVISNGNTVRNTEYSFLANVFAARGYLVASVQQDLPTDPPLVTKVGEPYVGRLPVYKKGEANILFTLDELKKRHPNADYEHLTMVGHSNGGDTAMYFAKEHPDMVRQIVTLDNLRVPFVIRDKMKILSFRSDDPQFQTDPGVLPKKLSNGINVIKTKFMHTWMSDRGPDTAKERIQATLDAFLGGEQESELAPAPVDTKNLIVSNDAAPQP